MLTYNKQKQQQINGSINVSLHLINESMNSLFDILPLFPINLCFIYNASLNV
mgnify:CR=1 FL=1